MHMHILELNRNKRNVTYLKYVAEVMQGKIVNPYEVVFDNDFGKGFALIYEQKNYRISITEYTAKKDVKVHFNTDKKYEYSIICFPQKVTYNSDEMILDINTPNGLLLIKKQDHFYSFNRAEKTKRVVTIFFNEKAFDKKFYNELQKFDAFAYHVGNKHLINWKRCFEDGIKEDLHPQVLSEWIVLKLEELKLLVQSVLYNFDINEESESYSDYEVNILYSIKNDIDENLSKKPILKELGKAYGINVNKLSLIFKSLFGNTVYSYFKNQRIHKVKEELEVSNKSITEIAYDYNFTDVNHLSKNFTETFGVSPSMFRKK